MKYLCLICAETVLEQMTDAAAEKHAEEYVEFTQDIKESGHYLGCNRLLPPGASDYAAGAKRQDHDDRQPLTQTKEQFGGYYLIEARDLNRAMPDKPRGFRGRSSAVSK